MESRHGFNFARLHFDAGGTLQDPASLDEVKAADGDVILIAHGFRNDENDATSLYDRFLSTFRDHLTSGAFPIAAARTHTFAGIYWPSKPFQESFGDGTVQAVDAETAGKEAVRAQIEDLKAALDVPEQRAKLDEAIALLEGIGDSAGAQDQFVSKVLSILEGAPDDPTEGGDRIRATEGSVLLDKLKVPIIVPSGNSDSEGGTLSLDAPAGDGEGGTQGIGSFFGSIFGRIGQFLNLTTWYLMKNRSGAVGAAGVAQAVRDLTAARPGIRVHLVGHSLGGRLMAGCAKSLAETHHRVESLTLLEAAFSHYGFSPNNGKGVAGFFREVVESGVVAGPLIATFSAQDTVVGRVYAVASRLAGDSVQEIGDANDAYGGIGRNGAQKTPEAESGPLHAVGNPYQFHPAKVECLDGSGGLIRDHGDVTNATVTYAFASVIEAT
ncbi:MAG TPA: hypothetical protein VHD76_14750 [Bryobacteraceae bacterium]|jgi:hypothetical protein|nr:hypothetical protein [Bryobacteraceae bacterium]